MENPEIANDSNFKYTDVQVTCIHYGPPAAPRQTNGARPNQSYNGKKCSFQIKFSFNKASKTYILRKLHAVHANHEVDKESFEKGVKLTHAEKTMIADCFFHAKNLHPTNADMIKMIKNMTGKNVTARDCSNLSQFKQLEDIEK